jgi:hypothetical protein
MLTARKIGSARSDLVDEHQAVGFRLAVLVAETTISRRLVEDAYLNARQLSVDLRQAATWLGDGARFGA